MHRFRLRLPRRDRLNHHTNLELNIKLTIQNPHLDYFLETIHGKIGYELAIAEALIVAHVDEEAGAVDEVGCYLLLNGTCLQGRDLQAGQILPGVGCCGSYKKYNDTLH